MLPALMGSIMQHCTAKSWWVGSLLLAFSGISRRVGIGLFCGEHFLLLLAIRNSVGTGYLKVGFPYLK